MNFIRLTLHVDCATESGLLTTPEISQIPNDETARAIRELDVGKGASFDGIDDLFRDLGLDE